jgi:hypothetical protein
MGKVVYETYGEILTEESDGRYVLSVLCGGIAMFAVDIVLNEEEIAFWQDFGDYGIHTLALRIARNPEAYADRRLSSSPQAEGCESL